MSLQVILAVLCVGWVVLEDNVASSAHYITD